MMILQTRFAYTPYGTFSTYNVNGFECFMIEPPWRNNEPSISCIPEGWYNMQMRSSAVVERTTHGEYTKGWEIRNVPQRSWIMCHPGNIMDHTEGCQCPGDMLGFINNKWAVGNSMKTFRKLMDVLSLQNEWTLKIVRGEL